MDIIRLLRPRQWSKNLFLFLPIFFAQAIGDYNRLWACCIAFIVMSMASSCIYVLNDLRDVDFDRNHPEKSQRPLASGRISITVGYILYAILLILTVAVTLIFFPSVEMICTVAIYILLNHLYSLFLKHVALLDVMIVASGFVLRIIVGAIAASVVPSHWIIIMTFLLALFLVLTKRRDDVIKYEKNNITTRRNVLSYNRAFLDQTLTLVAGVTLVSYIMYTVDAEVIEQFHCNYVYSTAIFVLAGILRYLQLTLVEEKCWSPTRIVMHDRFLQCCIIGWLILFTFIIYG